MKFLPFLSLQTIFAKRTPIGLPTTEASIPIFEAVDGSSTVIIPAPAPVMPNNHSVVSLIALALPDSFLWSSYFLLA